MSGLWEVMILLMKTVSAWKTSSSFAGHAAHGIQCQASIQDGVGNGVANFVRVAFADGFRGEDVTA